MVRRLAPWVALLVILTPLLIGGLYVYHIYENKYHPADYAGAGTSPTVNVEVQSGDTAFSLGPRLVQLGVVASSRAFELAAEHATSTAGLEVGFYKMNHHMQASLAYAALLNPKNRVQLTVTIPEGKRASQVVAILAKATSIPLANFQRGHQQPRPARPAGLRQRQGRGLPVPRHLHDPAERDGAPDPPGHGRSSTTPRPSRSALPPPRRRCTSAPSR